MSQGFITSHSAFTPNDRQLIVSLTLFAWGGERTCKKQNQGQSLARRAPGYAAAVLTLGGGQNKKMA